MSNLDMTLEDRIKINQSSSRDGARTFGTGPTRRFPTRSATRDAPYSFAAARAPETQWDQSIYPIQGAARVLAIETGTKLLVSNLDYGVTDEDLKELFSALGDLKRCSVNYDRSGRSEGTAEVVFSRRRDAEAAIKSYNNVQLDGKPMNIEIIGANMAPHTILPQAPYGEYRINGGGPIRNARVQGRGGAMRRPQGAVHNSRNGRGGGRGRNEKISAEDLDADLDSYIAEAKETN
ncbi:hypothetical protein ACJIZ3_024145 [Penstemon smallii]|uniref:RRM domain-containing protein n=1 Tax=Penstemon smallii TaxID=265156 RepID=A0ABD3TR04_9LAMI